MRDYLRGNLNRWLRWIALAVVFAVACGFLANWQWNRRVQVIKVITRLDRNYDHTVLPVEQLVPSTAGFSLKMEYRPVLLSGHYLATDALLLRNQVANGNPGFDHLVPFQLDSGKVIVVDRGWLSTGLKQDLPDTIPAFHSGKMRVVGRLIHLQQPDKRQAPAGQAMSINPVQLNEQWHYPSGKLYQGVFVRLAAEDPAPKTYPVLATKPDINEGNHLSYAFQWVLFAVLAFVSIGANVRKDILEMRAKRDPNFVPKARKRKRLGEADAETEDALLGD
jgi:cytochrome oxidase assembly protein ShyY1